MLFRSIVAGVTNQGGRLLQFLPASHQSCQFHHTGKATGHEVVLQYDDEAPEVVTYTLSLTNKPTEPKLPQTGDNMNPWFYIGVGVIISLLGLGMWGIKKKSKIE